MAGFRAESDSGGVRAGGRLEATCKFKSTEREVSIMAACRAESDSGGVRAGDRLKATCEFGSPEREASTMAACRAESDSGGVRAGDRLEATCEFDSTEREAVTTAGATHAHEMCNLYMMMWSELPVFMTCSGAGTHGDEPSINPSGAGAAFTLDPML